MLVARVASGAVEANTDAAYTVTIDTAADVGTVSPELMGFNVIYCYERDADWQHGRGQVPTLLARLHTQVLRYPAGTVVTFYHWKNPTGQGWADSWDPDFDPKRSLPDEATMSLDEYVDVVKAMGTKALIGVNMGSGARFKARRAENIADAVAMVKHCVDRGIRGAYYYLDNEPYRPDANHPFTPGEYADEINAYAPALRAVDPQLKIIANLHSGPNAAGYDWTRRAVIRAGANIDFADFHFYWRHNSTSFAAWVSEPHMLHQRTAPYSEQRKIYQKLFAEAGFPAIEPITLEWNISDAGPQTPPTPAQAAVMVAEQFMQFIASGMKMATFWPLQLPRGKAADYRYVLDAKRGSAPHQLYTVFEQFKDIGGQTQLLSNVHSASEAARLTALALRSVDGKQVTVYLINKNQELKTVKVKLELQNFSGFESASTIGFKAADQNATTLAMDSIETKVGSDSVTLTLPTNSFARVVVREE